jgi:hypothetical protein
MKQSRLISNPNYYSYWLVVMTNDNGVLNRENEEEDEDKNTGS